MWFLTDMQDEHMYKIGCFTLDESFGRPLEGLGVLTFEDFETGDYKEIVFTEQLIDELSTIDKVRTWLVEQLFGRTFNGFYDSYLFSVNKLEYKLLDYFEEDGLVKRVGTPKEFYAASKDDDNLIVLNYNLKYMTVMQLLLTHPEAFVYEEDAFYYELTDYDLAFRYKYLRGRKKFETVVTKLKIQGNY